MLKELLFAFAILATCVVIHIIGMASLAWWLLRQRFRIKRKSLMTTTLLLIGVFAVVVVLHLVEATIWAGFYYTENLFGNFETASYFSLLSYTTVGYGDVLLPERWRLLGVLEGLSGVLLCGLSTAFIFAIVNALFQARLAPPTREAAAND